MPTSGSRWRLRTRLPAVLMLVMIMSVVVRIGVWMQGSRPRGRSCEGWSGVSFVWDPRRSGAVRRSVWRSVVVVLSMI